ncbi:hypothetical protein KR044_011269, partial [Drosophila immigrans]
FWKTLNIQKSYKLHYYKIFLISLISLPVLSLLRALTIPKVEQKVIYDPVDIDSLDKMRDTLKEINSTEVLVYKLYYSPRYKPFEEIIAMTVEKLKLEGYDAVDNQSEMDLRMQQNNYFAGVQFLDAETNITELPLELAYELRFPPVLRSSPKPKNPLLWGTTKLYPLTSEDGGAHNRTNHTGVPPGYFEEGFVQLQHAIAMSFLELKSGHRDLSKVGIPKIEMVSFPVRRRVRDDYIMHLKMLLPLTILFTYAFPSVAIVKAITDENERGIMKMMRIEELNWCAWVSIIFLSQLTSTVLILMILVPSWGTHAIFQYSNWTTVFLFLVCYVCSNCSFIIMISVVVIGRSKNAKYALMIRLCTFAPYPFLVVFYNKVHMVFKLLACLSHDTGLAIGLFIILEFESSGEGFGWKNIRTPHFAGDELCCSHICGMLLLDAVIYMLILVYQHYKSPPEVHVMQVDKETVAKRWYYPWQALYDKLRTHKEHGSLVSRLLCNNGIQVLNVTKTVGDTDYLKDITMIIHPNEVTVILNQRCDHNSMLLSHIISGDVGVSSGRVIVNGHDVQTYKGTDTLCTILPKDSIVFSQLSVVENLYLYMHLRGMRNYRQIIREIRKYIALLRMDWDEAECLADSLSFGQARCLSVCCTLCGGDHAVIVEDPSQGLNQTWKYRTWDLLKHAGRSRVLIVNTPYCDEAEYLGDRIAVVYSGQLQCFDRNEALMERFCNNYTLYGDTLDGGNANDNDFIAVLLRHYPSAAYVRSLPSSGRLDVMLPMGQDLHLADLVADLEAQSKPLGLGRLWVKTQTLRDVFMKDSLDFGEIAKVRVIVQRCFHTDHMEEDEFKRTCHQFGAFMRKKLIQLMRFHWLPIGIMLLLSGCVFFNMQSSHFSHLPGINITLTTYPETVVLMKRADLSPEMATYSVTEGYEQHHRRIDGRSKTDHVFTYLRGRRELQPYLIFLQMISKLRVKTFYVVAAAVSEDSILCYWNNKLIHAAPISLNMMHNALAVHLLGPGSEIRLTNRPIQFSNNIILEQFNIHSSMRLGLGNMLILLLCAIIALMVVPLISEYTKGNRRVIYLSGNNMTMYWVSHMLADMFVFTVVIVYLVVLLVVHDVLLNAEKRNYDDGVFVFHMFLVLLLFGMAVLPFVYLIAALFARIFFGFVITLFILGGSSVFIVLVIQLTELQGSAFLYGLFFWSPTMNMYRGLRNLHVNRALRRACEQLGGCDRELACCTLADYADYEYPGVFSELVLLVVQTFSYGSLLLCVTKHPFVIEDWLWRLRQRYKRSSHSSGRMAQQVSSDVWAERRRVDDLSWSDLKALPVVFKGVSKHVGNQCKLNDVSFAVMPRQVFGVVGSQDSGKSEVISLTVGAESISSGDIFVAGSSVRDRPKETYTQLGYCPAGNALFSYMTVREILHFYCLLNGRKLEQVPQIIHNMCVALHLDKYTDTRIDRLGFSQRRQLTVVISVLSSTNTVMMAEPTRGMGQWSKMATRQLIRVLKHIGRTVVMATEDFDEAIELCDCIAFLVDGMLRSIGTVDYLTSLHSRGCMVELQLIKVIYARPRDNYASLLDDRFDNISSVDEDSEPRGRPSEYSFSSRSENDLWVIKALRYSDLASFMESELPFAELRGSYDLHRVYYIPFDAIPLSSVFRAMVAVQEELNVYSYRITCTSVSEIY